MKRLLTLWLSLTIALTLCAHNYTFEECVEVALNNNLTLQQQRQEYSLQRLQYTQSRQNLLPSLNGNIAQNFSFGRATGADNVTISQNMANTNIALNANLIIFDGLAMKFKIDEARANMEASEHTTRQVELNIRMNITTMFLQILLNKELLNVADTQLLTTQQNVERSRQLVQQGRLAEGELLTLESQLANEQLQRTEAQNRLLLSLLDLAQAMNVTYDDNFDITIPQWLTDEQQLLPSNEEVYNAALRNRPEIQAAHAQLLAKQHALKTAKAAYSPVLSAGANLSTGYYHKFGADNDNFGNQLSNNLSSGVALNLSIPIFDKMQTPNNITRQKIAIESQQTQITQVEQTLKKEIDQAYYNAIAAQTQQMSAQQAEHSAKEAYRYAEQKYLAGRSTAYEFNSAKNSYTAARSQYLQAKFNYLFKVKILTYYMAQDL